MTLASLAALLGWLVGLLMVVEILFASLGANTANPWVGVVGSWAARLSFGLANLNVTPIPEVDLWIGYGIATIVWVVMGTVLRRAIRWMAARRARRASTLGRGG